MARELVLIPIMKYKELITNINIDRSNSKNDEMAAIEHNSNDVIKKDINENNKIDLGEVTKHDNQHEAIENNKEDKPVRKSSRVKKKPQKGGKLFMKSTPRQFMQKIHNKRKWQSFDL